MYLTEPGPSPERDAMYDSDLDGLGYVMNLTRVWAQVPDANHAFGALLARAAEAGGLTFRQRGVLVSACASTLGDSYCSMAWGIKLAGVSSATVAAGVVTGDDSGLTAQEQTLAAWARAVARDPNGTSHSDVQALRDAGFDDQQIFAITLFVALRMAFSTVNDALGALPDAALDDRAPEELKNAVTFGRPVEGR